MSADIWVTVPTAGRESLERAVDSTGIPRERIVVVATAPDVEVPAGCRWLVDAEPVNIHRWWNRGIDACVRMGARYVAVINDDVLMDEHTLPTLLDRMLKHGATVASPGADRRVSNDSKDMPMTIVGSCWLLDAASGLRADESFRWWYGDNKLDWDARRFHGGIVTASCYFHHLTPNHLTSESADLQALAQVDARLWDSL